MEVRKVSDILFELDVNQSITISFKLESDLLKEIDEAVKILGYTNRSDLIRDAIIEYIKEVKESYKDAIS
ncbi:MAG: ribbon-helix-helix domain-containing protein [Sulfolobaceae archaeon]|nr:ribbon-helix-helix domain-containing protein [Sulfolobaceae archaeon]